MILEEEDRPKSWGYENLVCVECPECHFSIVFRESGILRNMNLWDIERRRPIPLQPVITIPEPEPVIVPRRHRLLRWLWFGR